MRIQINDREVIIPSSLSEFTLGQRIAFQEQYGRELDEMLKSILEMEEGFERDLELTEFQFEKMFRTMAFFCETTPEALKESEFVDDIARIYHANLAVFLEDESNVEFSTEVVWDGALWEIHPPELKQGSKMTFGEFIDSKQLVKDMIDLGGGKWDCMLKLCAIYLRHKGEPFQEEFLYEDSPRLELMKSLPMNIALQVGFFLTSSMNLFINSFLSSSQAALSPAAGTAPNTSSAGDGSTSSKRSLKRKSSTSPA